MASTYGVEAVLQAILVELIVANQMAAEENGKDAELEDMRAEAFASFGDTEANVGTPELATIVGKENS